MKLRTLAFVLACAVTSAQSQDTLTNETIMRMAAAGVPASVMIQTINAAPSVAFRFLPGDLTAMNQAKVPDEVFKAMSARSNRATSAPISPAQAPTAPPVSAPQASVPPAQAPPTQPISNTPQQVPLAARTSQGPTPFVLLDGTPVKLRLARNLSSADAQVGETVDFEVLEEITLSGITVIPKGATALGTVTEAQSKRRMGRAGKLNVVVEYARLANGEKAALRAAKESAGGSNVGKMTGAIVATSIVFFPAAPLFLLAHGKDVNIPKGTEITAYINGDMKIDSAKLGISQETARPIATLATPTGTLTADEIVKLKRAGFSDGLILSRIESAGAVQMKSDVDSLTQLKSAGLSDEIISAMLKKTAGK